MAIQDQQPPWGQKKKPSSPEDILAAIIQKIRDSFSENGKGADSSGGEGPPPSTQSPLAGIGKIAAVLIAVMLFQVVYSSFYTIAPNQSGVILRFGRYDRSTEPGLHFKIPYIEELYKVDLTTFRTEEFGFRKRNNTVLERRGYDKESLMLTGDKNVIDVAWIVQYNVSDPFSYLFKVQNVPQAVRDFSEMVMRRIVGNMDFDYVLSNRELLAGGAKLELQSALDKLECGVKIQEVKMQDITPPDPVKPAFNEVNAADQDKERLVNEAEAEYLRIIPKAKGDAKKLVEEAYGYAIQRVNRAKGETTRFNSIVSEYLVAEEVTRRRMYLEAMQEILPHVDHVYVLDKEQKSILPFLDLTGQGKGLK